MNTVSSKNDRDSLKKINAVGDGSTTNTVNSGSSGGNNKITSF